MASSTRAEHLVSEIADAKLGDIKRLAAEIKKDHELALELWATGAFRARLLAVLVFDKARLTQEAIDKLASDILAHDESEGAQLTDWLLANQLMKDRKLAALMETWEHNPSPILRRLFWYHQARLRWMGNAPPGNTKELMESLEKGMTDAEPIVQWAMNFCAGQIGIHEPEYRSRCIALGERLGLYKDQKVPKNCVPSYLPEFIRIEAAKRENGHGSR
jgi:3-methyladenine DNA glycosylase AlkD